MTAQRNGDAEVFHLLARECWNQRCPKEPGSLSNQTCGLKTSEFIYLKPGIGSEFTVIP